MQTAKQTVFYHAANSSIVVRIFVLISWNFGKNEDNE